MKIILGVFSVLFGGLGWFTQLISCVNPRLAQRLGFQERSEDTDLLFQKAELNTARWDALTLWILVVSGALMLLDHEWWPYVSLIAGGIYLDAGGREAAKYITLRKSGVKTGNVKNFAIAFGAYTLMVIFGIIVIVYALAQIKY